MSRKEFVAIAKVLKAYSINVEYNDPDFRDLVCDLMVVFKESNPNFDESRFIAAVYD